MTDETKVDKHRRAQDMLGAAETQAHGFVGEAFVSLDDPYFDSIRVRARNGKLTYDLIYRRDCGFNAEQLAARRINPHTYSKWVQRDRAIETIRNFAPEFKAELAARVDAAMSRHVSVAPNREAVAAAAAYEPAHLWRGNR